MTKKQKALLRFKTVCNSLSSHHVNLFNFHRWEYLSSYTLDKISGYLEELWEYKTGMIIDDQIVSEMIQLCKLVIKQECQVTQLNLAQSLLKQPKTYGKKTNETDSRIHSI